MTLLSPTRVGCVYSKSRERPANVRASHTTHKPVLILAAAPVERRDGGGV